MNDSPNAADPFGWFEQLTRGHQPMYCWFLRNTYLENRLRDPGGTVQCGVPVDLSRIDVPAFVYASREDHIVPWQTAYASTHLLGGETLCPGPSRMSPPIVPVNSRRLA